MNPLENDVGLSARGVIQAAALATRLLEIEAISPERILSSPRRRCLETLGPLGQRSGCGVEVEMLLEEGGEVERKVRDFITLCTQMGTPCVVACTHGDWLPVFADAIGLGSLSFGTAEGLELAWSARKGWKQIQVFREPLV